jgi:PadR family transcriptional regulator PadR
MIAGGVSVKEVAAAHIADLTTPIRTGNRTCVHNAAMRPHSDGDADHVPEAPGQPRNWLRPFLLLSLEQWQSHGYELIRRLSLFGFEAVDPGSVYRTLRHLERDGLVESDWDTTGGPARRRYAVTDAGRIYLDGWAASLRAYQYMLDQFFDTYPGEAPDAHDGPRDISAQTGSPSARASRERPRLDNGHGPSDPAPAARAAGRRHDHK